jgi:hypothetical protein
LSHKYNAKKTVIDGITFDSKKEAMRYEHLKNLERVGKIDRLVLQPRYTLQDKFECADGEKLRKIEYVADFEYEEDGVVIVEDVKGMKTDVYKLKRKWFKHNYDGVYVHREV